MFFGMRRHAIRVSAVMGLETTSVVSGAIVDVLIRAGKATRAFARSGGLELTARQSVLFGCQGLSDDLGCARFVATTASVSTMEAILLLRRMEEAAEKLIADPDADLLV